MGPFSPQVAIGIPVYNGERYLARTIECMLAQTFQDFEIVISDNASTDRTPEICRRYADRDSRVRYHRNEENLGAAPNFNRAFELSRAPYFTWTAHDDLYAPTYLERCLAVLEADPDVVLAHTSAGFIDEEGHPVELEPGTQRYVDEERGIRMSLDPPHLAETPAAEQRFDDVLHRVSWCLQVFGVIRSSALRRTKLQRSYYGADKVLLADLALLGRFHEIEEILFFKRLHRGMSFRLSVKEKRKWIDPNARRGIPQLLMLRDYTAGLLTARLHARQRARCALSVMGLVGRHGLWHRIFVPGPDNYLGIDFTRRARRGQ